MKKLVYSLLVLCSAGLLAWACNSMDESVAVTDLEESLNLQAPSGMKIANSMLDLKEILVKNTEMSFDGVEITNIDYLPVNEGYIAMMTCLFPDGKVLKIANTNWSLNSDGRLIPPSLNLSRTKSGSESGLGGGTIFVCKSMHGKCSYCEMFAISGDDIILDCLCKKGINDCGIGPA